MHRKILAVILMAATSLAAADTLDVGLSDSMAQFKYGVSSSLAGRSEIYAEVMYNDASSVMGGVGLLVASDEANAPGLTLGVGAKAVAATIKKAPVKSGNSAIALGAQVRYELPAERRVALSGEAYFAPKIITYGDADRYQQYGARVEFAVSPQVQLYIGYRKTWFDLTNSSADAVMINGTYLGMQLSF